MGVRYCNMPIDNVTWSLPRPYLHEVRMRFWLLASSSRSDTQLNDVSTVCSEAK